MAKSRSIPAGEFKARCLQLMDQVKKTRNPIVITKRGKPVAKIVPVEAESEDTFACMEGTVRIVGDIISSIDVAWEANE